MPTAAAYIRVSTEDQMEFSPDSQLRSIQAYALNHHIELLPAHIYLCLLYTSSNLYSLLHGKGSTV